MSDNAQLPNLTADDGSLDGAVAAMQDIDFDNLISFEDARNGMNENGRQPPIQPRDPKSQQFKEIPKPADQLRTNQPVDPKMLAKAEADLAAEPEVSAPEEEFFEIAGSAEGEAPRRVPATEVWEVYQEADRIRTENAELRRNAPPPDYWDQEITRTVQMRGELAKMAQYYEQMLTPQMPSQELLNQASPHYNPQAYNDQLMLAQQMQAQVNGVRNHLSALEAQQAQEQQALQQARFSREQSKLRTVWPEVMTDTRLRQRVVETAARHYGIMPADFASTVDARFYAILRDAMKFHDGQQAQAQAVKVVRGKPKLVRGTARNPDTGRQIATNNAMRRASQSGSLDDAANAIGQLLS